MINVAIFCPKSIVNIFRSKLANNSLCRFLFVYEEKNPNVLPDEYQYDKIKDWNYYFLKEYSIDLAVVYYWNYRFPEAIVNEYNIYNLHPSLLPKYRGPYPVLFQLLNNEHILGLTLHKMDSHFDTGDIYLQEQFSIGENYQLINIKLFRLSIKLISILIDNFAKYTINLTPQNHAQATYYCKKDLDKYIITENFNLHEFQRLSKIFSYFPPFKVLIDSQVYNIKSYDISPTPNGKKFDLCDSTVYINIDN